MLDLGDKKNAEIDYLEDNPLDLGIIESEDKRIYENRISELVADRLYADSKAAHFYLECLALQNRVQSREKKKVITFMSFSSIIPEVILLFTQKKLWTSYRHTIITFLV